MGTQPPPQKGVRAPFPIFGPFLLWPNGWMQQDAPGYGGRPCPMPYCVRWGPSSLPLPPTKIGDTAPNFWPMSIVVKWSPISAKCLALVLHLTTQSKLERPQLKLHPSTLAIFQPTEKLYSCCYLFTVLNSGLLFYTKRVSTMPSQPRPLPSPTHS